MTWNPGPEHSWSWYSSSPLISSTFSSDSYRYFKMCPPHTAVLYCRGVLLIFELSQNHISLSVVLQYVEHSNHNFCFLVPRSNPWPAGTWVNPCDVSGSITCLMWRVQPETMKFRCVYSSREENVWSIQEWFWWLVQLPSGRKLFPEIWLGSWQERVWKVFADICVPAYRPWTVVQ